MNKKVRRELIAGPWDGKFLYLTGGSTLPFKVGPFKGYYQQSLVRPTAMFWTPQ